MILLKSLLLLLLLLFVVVVAAAAVVAVVVVVVVAVVVVVVVVFQVISVLTSEDSPFAMIFISFANSRMWCLFFYKCFPYHSKFDVYFT